MAVSTAAPSLDYVVVADTPTAQACVDLLRQKRLGVATFLILDKQAHLARKAAEAAATPEGAAPLLPNPCVPSMSRDALHWDNMSGGLSFHLDLRACCCFDCAVR